MTLLFLFVHIYLVNNYISSGLSQGGHLRSFLFTLFISSIIKYLSCIKCLLFDNDIKIYHRIDSPSDFCLLLQSELKIVCEWVHRILYLNKVYIMFICQSRTPIIHAYFLNGTLFERISNINDLGLHYTACLRFDHHINITVGREVTKLQYIIIPIWLLSFLTITFPSGSHS